MANWKHACLALGIVVILLAQPTSPSRAQTTPVYITAAHIDLSKESNLKLMYRDTANDIAYYLRTDYSYTSPKVGSTVRAGDITGRVISTTNQVFYIKLDGRVYEGLSGIRVHNTKGQVIGFISEYMMDGTVKCVCLN